MVNELGREITDRVETHEYDDIGIALISKSEVRSPGFRVPRTSH